MLEVDADGSGTIDFEEFASVYVHIRATSRQGAHTHQQFKLGLLREDDDDNEDNRLPVRRFLGTSSATGCRFRMLKERAARNAPTPSRGRATSGHPELAATHTSESRREHRNRRDIASTPGDRASVGRPSAPPSRTGHRQCACSSSPL